MTGPASAGSVELILASVVTLTLSGNVQDTLVRGRYSIMSYTMETMRVKSLPSSRTVSARFVSSIGGPGYKGQSVRYCTALSCPK